MTTRNDTVRSVRSASHVAENPSAPEYVGLGPSGSIATASPSRTSDEFPRRISSSTSRPGSRTVASNVSSRPADTASPSPGRTANSSVRLGAGASENPSSLNIDTPNVRGTEAQTTSISTAEPAVAIPAHLSPRVRKPAWASASRSSRQARPSNSSAIGWPARS